VSSELSKGPGSRRSPFRTSGKRDPSGVTFGSIHQAGQDWGWFCRHVVRPRDGCLGLKAGAGIAGKESLESGRVEWASKQITLPTFAFFRSNHCEL
jgi:hypothetical protein